MGLINPVVSARLLALIEESDLSGRDGAYDIAIGQFLSSPLYGDYFVLTSGPLAGLYPHNIILESLMTLGLIGSIPLFILFLRSIYQGIKLFKINHQFVWLFFIFLSVFFKGQSTWNLYASDELWISMAILVTIKIKEGS